MNCPGCGAAGGEARWEVGDRLFGTTARRFWIVRCPACALEFLSPAPTPSELTTFYPSGYWASGAAVSARAGSWTRLAEAYRWLVLRDHVRFVRRVIEQQKAGDAWRGLLDVGCGDGSFLAALGARPAAGLDASAEAARAVRRRGFPAVRGGLDDPPFRAGSFSLVTMFHYLEHVASAAPSLEAVRHLLAPGGRLVVQVPNLDCWQRRLLRSRWAGYDPPRHLVHYSTATLRDTLVRHGYEVLHVTHASMRDNPATLANSVAPRLYPPARLARTRTARGAGHWAASLAYLGLVLAAFPFALLESALRHGASVMMEARLAR